MNRVHLVLVWHMHQPQYRDPGTGRYLLPWTRLHALKDYWGMVNLLEATPGVHVTFNIVPSLGQQLEEYASGKFDEPWFELAFLPAENLTPSQKIEILDRAFQVNRETLLSRWPRFVELFDRRQDHTTSAAASVWGLRDWRDVQLLSQLAWMDEEYLARDPVVSALSAKGANFTEEDKAGLRAKQLELLARVLPAYRSAAERGQVELSTTPFYHPILPLVCDTDVAQAANPGSPPLIPAFRHPEDARAQLAHARAYHERVFGKLPEGLWPSEGSVSDASLEIACALGFRWFATDEGILGRTLNVGFWRDASGHPENASQLYQPWRLRRPSGEITGFFRDHFLSDLIGFVYSRMDAGAAAEDLHRRVRAAGERTMGPGPATVSIILDGENAWEYYPGAGREFLRQFYRRIEADPDIRALSVSEAIAAAGKLPTMESVAPGSWINANFDIWIGDVEDRRAWELLREARDAYGRGEQRAKAEGGPSAERLARALESVLAAEGSDWCWWYGPEHSTANDADFDELYRKLLTEIYSALGEGVPDMLAQPIRRRTEQVRNIPPAAFVNVTVDGRDTTFFEWLGAGLYATHRHRSVMHGRTRCLEAIQYGFSADAFYVRVEIPAESLEKLRDCEIRITVRAGREIKCIVRVREGRLAGSSVEGANGNPPIPGDGVRAALERFLEVGFARHLFDLAGRTSVGLSVAVWHGGLPVDVLPGSGELQIALGEENFAWPIG